MNDHAMNDHALTAALTAYHREGAALPEPPGLRFDVTNIPISHRRSARWLPSVLQGRFRTMLSATGFVAAGVIVALVGGIALTGTLSGPRDGESIPAVGASATASAVASIEEPSVAPSIVVVGVPATDLLPGVDLEVEEVAAGVWHVLGDGTGRALDGLGQVVVGPAGDVWVARSDGVAVFAVGRPGQYRGGGDLHSGSFVLVLDPQGRPRIHHRQPRDEKNGSATYDGEQWVKSLPNAVDRARADRGRAVGPSGDTWSVRDGIVLRRADSRNARYGRDEMGFDPRLDVLEGRRPLEPRQVLASPAGRIWVLWDNAGRPRLGAPEPGPEPGGLFAITEFDGQAWRVIRRDGWLDEDVLRDRGLDVEPGDGPDAFVAPDGTLWAMAAAAGLREVSRWAGEAWEIVATMPNDRAEAVMFAPDGTAWLDDLTPLDGGPIGRVKVPNALGSDDNDIAFAPDGSIWVVVPEGFDAGSLYVIRPELAEVELPES